MRVINLTFTHLCILRNNLMFLLNLVILHSEVTSSTQPSYKLSRGYKHSQNRASDLYSMPSLSVNICSVPSISFHRSGMGLYLHSKTYYCEGRKSNMSSTILPTRVLCRLPNRTLVNRSARLSFEGTCPVSISPIATASRTAW